MAFRALFLVALLVPFVAGAQAIPTLDPGIEIQTIPGAPGPNQTVVVQAAVDGSTALGASYTWSVNGRVVDQGNDVSRITVTTGDVGSATTINVSIVQNGTLIGNKTLVLRPASVDLVWEGNTYVPPFYVGRPLPNGSSPVTLTAIPDIVQGGVRISSGSLTYRWYVNNSQTPYRSGYGLNAITLIPPLFESTFKVSVVASTLDNTVSAASEVSITPTQPRVKFYEIAPLLGTRFDRAITNVFALSGDEVTVMAAPFFVQDIDTPTYTWRVGGFETNATGSTGREITLRKTGAGGGQTSVEFNLNNASKLFEQTRASFLVTF